MSNALETWQDFEGELSSRDQEIASMLPSNMDPARFKNWAIAAVKQNPELLLCTPRSLFQSITRSAQDGILPDGREGVIGVYNTKVKRNGQEVWEKQAQWNPMTFGLRKRARELDRLLIDAQVVYDGDHFVWHQGDEPRIEHEPARLGTPRGKMIGAYAIFKREDGDILAREVMDALQIETVREQSKQPDGLMWKKFTTEAWRKTVIRRGIKATPVSDVMAQIIQRDDEANFDFADRATEAALVPPPAPSTAPQVEHKPGEVLPDAEPTAEKAPVKRKTRKPRSPKEQGTPVGDGNAAQPAPNLPGEFTPYLERQRDELAKAKDAHEAQCIHSTVEDSVQGAVERGEISKEDQEMVLAAWSTMTEPPKL